MKFDMGEAWQEAMAMIAANREVLLIVAGIFFFLPSLLAAIVLPDMQTLFLNSTDPEVMEAQLMEFYSSYSWVFMLVTLLQVIGTLSLLALLRDSAKPTVGEAIKAGFVGLLPAIGAYLLVIVGLAILFGIVGAVVVGTGSPALSVIAVLLGVVFFVYLWVKLSLSAPVIAIDKVYNPFRILGTSWRLTSGNTGRLLLFYVLILIVYIIVSMVVGIFAAVFLFLGAEIGMIVNGILSGLVGAAVSVLFVGILASIHRQLAGPSAEAVRETFE